MELHVSTEGTYIRKRGECFLVCKDKDKTEWSARKVDRIILSPHISLTSDVVELAIENNVDIIFIRWNGEPLARLWHPGHGSTAAIRRAQLLLGAGTMESVVLVKRWACEKLNNQEDFLRELARNRKSKKEKTSLLLAADEVARINKVISNIHGEMDEIRPVLMGHEGCAAKAYFGGISATMPLGFQFTQRTRRPAKDPFNACLNYGYGMLYSRVERALIIAGLDPYLGFLHVDRYNKPSLVYDFIEPFRIWIDRPVTRLFTKKSMYKKDFVSRAGQISLEKSAKHKLVTAVNAFLADRILYKRRRCKRENILQTRAHELAMSVMKGEVCSSGQSMTYQTTEKEQSSQSS